MKEKLIAVNHTPGKAPLELVLCTDCGFIDHIENAAAIGHKCTDCDSNNIVPIGTYDVDPAYLEGKSISECVNFDTDMIEAPKHMTREQVLETLSEVACTDLFQME